MRLDIHRGGAEQQVERHQAPEQTLAAAPRHNHQDGGDADVRRREGGRRTLAHLLRALHQVVEEAVLVAGAGQQFLVVVEVAAYGGEVALQHLVHAYGGEVELGTGHRDEDIDEVVDEERRDNDERHLLNQPEAVDEVPQHHNQHHGVVEEVAHVERLAHPYLRQELAEPHRRLPAEEPLLGRGKEMVEVGEEAIELERVGIPVGQQRHLYHHPDEHRQSARSQPVEVHQQERHARYQHTVDQHADRMVHLLKQKQYQYGRQQPVDEAYLLDGKQALARLYPAEQVGHDACSLSVCVFYPLL